MVPRKKIDVYIKNKKLKGVVGLLDSFSEEGNLHSFLTSNNIKVSLPPKVKVLFHGSATDSKVLLPQSENGESAESFVYATSDPNYAIFLAILNLKDASAGVVSTKRVTQLTVDTDFVNGKSTLKPGYVHIIFKKGFRKTSNNEFVSETEATVLFSIKVTPADLTVPIEVGT